MKKISFIIINLILIIIPTIALAFDVNATPSIVQPGETFKFTITMNENIYLANAHLKYDPSLFTYSRVITPGITVKKISDGELAWVYDDFTEPPVGTKNIEFEFKAKSLMFDTDTNFDITDAIFINTSDNVYENMDFTKTIKLKGKETTDLPATGSLGKDIVYISGISFIVIGIYFFKVKIKD